MEWQIKIRDQILRVNVMANPCLTQWLPVTVDDHEWEICWNQKLQSFFLRDSINNGYECALRLADFQSSKEPDQLGRQATLQGVYQGQSFRCSATILLSAPGVGQRVASQQNKGCRIRSPMVGRVLAVKIAPGQVVAKGEEMIVIEAMKMENKIFAPQAGVVDQVSVRQDQQVTLGEELVSLKASES